MKHELWYSVVVRDRQGKVLSRERRRSRSFLKQWNQLMFAQTTAVTLSGADGIKDTGGTLRNARDDAENFRVERHGSFSGIFCGTGDTAVAVDDFQLEGLIENGTGPGQFSYPMSTVTAVSISDSHAQFLVSRSPVNNSGDTITVREVGIYAYFYDLFYMCAVRDVLETPQDVPNGGALTVDYTLEVVA